MAGCKKDSVLQKVLQRLFPHYFNKGVKWERKVVKSLKNKRKFRKYGVDYVLHSIYLPTKQGGWTEVDCVILCQHGIFVVECKDYAGVIQGKMGENQWVQKFSQGKSYSFYSPELQNWGHIAALKSFLNRRNPKLFQSVLLFSDRSTLRLKGNLQENLWILQESQLKQQLKQWKKEMQPCFSSTELGEIFTILKKNTKVTGKVRRQHLQQVKQAQENATG